MCTRWRLQLFSLEMQWAVYTSVCFHRTVTLFFSKMKFLSIKFIFSRVILEWNDILFEPENLWQTHLLTYIGYIIMEIPNSQHYLPILTVWGKLTSHVVRNFRHNFCSFWMNIWIHTCAKVFCFPVVCSNCRWFIAEVHWHPS